MCPAKQADDEDKVFHEGVDGFEGLLPPPAFSEELTAHASEAGRWIELCTTQLLVVGVHEMKQPVLLMLTHGRHAGDAELGTLVFDQVMQLNASFLLAGIVAIKDGIAAYLKFVQVFDGGSVWR